MAKTKDKIEVVKINKSDDGETEEVFLYREEPYFNEVRYAKPGVYKLGVVTEKALESKEEAE